MNGRKREKKSETLEVRLPHSVKSAFMDRASARGETASEAVRTFISEYLDPTDPGLQHSKLKDLKMTILKHKRKSLALLSSGALAVAVFGTGLSAAGGSAFDVLDENKDGVLSAGEFFEDDADLIAALDADGSGGVSREELEANTNVMFTSTGEEEGKQVHALSIRIEDGELVPVSEEEHFEIIENDGEREKIIVKKRIKKEVDSGE